MQVALVQFTAGRDPVVNAEALRGLLPAAAGADVVVVPEAALADFGRPADPLVAEPLDGRFVSGLADCARELATTIVAGVFEQVADRRRAYNTVVAIGPDGSLIGRYRKLHLFDALGFAESTKLLPGDGALLTLQVAGHRLGVLTCYDLRFPELARALVDRGADTLVVPAAWVAGPLKEDHWVTLLRARAIENTCWVLAAAQSGPTYAGRSMLVDPMGVVTASLGETPGVARGTVSAERTASVRARLPVLDHRRFDVRARPPASSTT